MRVEIWSDVICPWCWIGAQRFEKALSQFDGREDVEIVHRAFRLAPGEPVQQADHALSQRYGMSLEKARGMMRQVEQTAALDGLTFHLDGTQLGDTRDAHRLIRFAAAHGLAHALTQRLWRAYFSENRSVFDHASLKALAIEVGLEGEEAEQVLKQRRYEEEVEADMHEATRLGARGVPFFLIDGRFAVRGAQSPEIFRSALRQALTEKPVSVGSEAGTCGPGGCEI